jgi:predicted small secreted protein
MRRILLAVTLAAAGLGLSGCWHDGVRGWGDHGGHRGGHDHRHGGEYGR